MGKDAGDCGLKFCVSLDPPCGVCCSAELKLLVATLILFVRCMVTVLQQYGVSYLMMTVKPKHVAANWELNT